jgi:hypothetical protein
LLAILVIGEVPGAGGPEAESSLELLHARDAEEAVEKLARNRRIDAVLVLAARDAEAIVATIREDLLSPPPIFLPAGAPQIPETRGLDAREPAKLIGLVAAALQG